MKSNLLEMLRRFQLNSAKKFKLLIYKMLHFLVLSCVAVILMLFLLKRIKTETYDLSSKFLADIIEEITTATTKTRQVLGLKTHKDKVSSGRV